MEKVELIKGLMALDFLTKEEVINAYSDKHCIKTILSFSQKIPIKIYAEYHSDDNHKCYYESIDINNLDVNNMVYNDKGITIEDIITMLLEDKEYHKLLLRKILFNIELFSAIDPRNKSIFAKKVAFPMFEISSNPTVRMSEIRARRFNIIDAMQKYQIGVIEKLQGKN